MNDKNKICVLHGPEIGLEELGTRYRVAEIKRLEIITNELGERTGLTEISYFREVQVEDFSELSHARIITNYPYLTILHQHTPYTPTPKPRRLGSRRPRSKSEARPSTDNQNGLELPAPLDPRGPRGESASSNTQNTKREETALPTLTTPSLAPQTSTSWATVARRTTPTTHPDKNTRGAIPKTVTAIRTPITDGLSRRLFVLVPTRIFGKTESTIVCQRHFLQFGEMEYFYTIESHKGNLLAYIQYFDVSAAKEAMEGADSKYLAKYAEPRKPKFDPNNPTRPTISYTYHDKCNRRVERDTYQHHLNICEEQIRYRQKCAKWKARLNVTDADFAFRPQVDYHHACQRYINHVDFEQHMKTCVSSSVSYTTMASEPEATTLPKTTQDENMQIDPPPAKKQNRTRSDLPDDLQALNNYQPQIEFEEGTEEAITMETTTLAANNKETMV